MKSVEQVLTDVERRLARTWASSAAASGAHTAAARLSKSPRPNGADATALTTGRGEAAEPDTRPATAPTAHSDEVPADTWPHAFPFGQPSSATLAGDFATAAAWTATWRAWSSNHGASLRTRTRRVMGTDQELATHLLVAGVDDAARLCGGTWPQRLQRGRRRAGVLADRFPHLLSAKALASTIAGVDELSDVDFDLLCRAGTWFACHEATGLTPRQVPIEGLHAKWLNTRQALVRRLSNRDDLGLLPLHPPRVHFTYLDPTHLATGGRKHDSATIGDRVAPAYLPRVVVISENKDTAIHFPEVPSGISVEGVGRGAGAIAALPWLLPAQHVLYWGDMDADGLEILNEFRAAGVPAVSLFMDLAAYAQWEQFGTNDDPHGRPLKARTPRPVPYLTEAEAALYRCLTSDVWHRYRRVEQERIPLSMAVAQVHRMVRDELPDDGMSNEMTIGRA
jgi:hypothetical protein